MSGFKSIAATSQYATDPDFDVHFDHNDKAEVTALLVGRKVAKASHDHLLLDDGTLLKLFGNDGGCGCNSGCYDLTALNDVDNVITNVEFEYEDDDWDQDKRAAYRIFVFADNAKVNLATFEGTDGNGYYGTGYHILVRRPSSQEQS